jgi:hypothetical protein
MSAYGTQKREEPCQDEQPRHRRRHEQDDHVRQHAVKPAIDRCHTKPGRQPEGQQETVEEQQRNAASEICRTQPAGKTHSGEVRAGVKQIPARENAEDFPEAIPKTWQVAKAVDLRQQDRRAERLDGPAPGEQPGKPRGPLPVQEKEDPGEGEVQHDHHLDVGCVHGGLRV